MNETHKIEVQTYNQDDALELLEECFQTVQEGLVPVAILNDYEKEIFGNTVERIARLLKTEGIFSQVVGSLVDIALGQNIDQDELLNESIEKISTEFMDMTIANVYNILYDFATSIRTLEMAKDE